MKIVTSKGNQGKELMDSIRRIESNEDSTALVAELHECLALSTNSLIRLAVIINRLEDLGVDIISLQIPNMNYFRKIASGQFMPELFIECSGSPGLLRKLSSLPISDQKRIADGSALKVILQGGDHLMVAPKDMTPSQIRQVFGTEGIRSDSQQAAWIVDSQQAKAFKRIPRPAIQIDRRKNGIVVGETFLSASDLAGYLSQLTAK